MIVEEFTDRLRAYGDKEAFWLDDRSVSYAAFVQMVDHFSSSLSDAGVLEGTPVLISGDIAPETLALLWACVSKGLICIPHLGSNTTSLESKMRVADPEWSVSAARSAAAENPLEIRKIDRTDTERPRHYDAIRAKRTPGLVLFTSGTTGEPKGAVHDFALLLEKFRAPSRALRTVGFLLFDHWGGLNTTFHTLLNGGTIVCVRDRAPASICRTIEASAAELLPVSPSFLNLLLASGAHRDFDLSSLRLVTYGAEPMMPATLQALRDAFPDLRLKQTYGLIELGVFPTKPRDDESLFFEIDKRQADYRVVDGILQIKTRSAMLGYLNAPSPFTEDGWYVTGDEVVTDGAYIRVLGRKSDIINVGGEKVHPSEVENVLLAIDGIVDARVYGEKNFLLGEIVCADLFCDGGVEHASFEKLVKKQCAQKLERFKVPVKIGFSSDPLLGDRLKKRRAAAAPPD